MQIGNMTPDDFLQRLQKLNTVGIALSREPNINRLLEMILLAAKDISDADAGTLYLLEQAGEKQVLRFEIFRNDSLGMAMGGTTGTPVSFEPISLTHADGSPNYAMVVACAALHQQTVNVIDAYTAEGFDFSGTRAFDKKTGYHSQSILVVPLKNHEGELIGMLQLINSIDRETGAVIPFYGPDQHLVESLASQAAIVLTNRQLINQLQGLFESFAGLINIAIDDKSPYTSGHCERIPLLTMMLADAATRTTKGPLKDFRMTEADRYELKIAGMLHDCGKISTPVHVVDKATKLQTIFDRINLIDTRFEIVRRDAEIRLLKARLGVEGKKDGGGLEQVHYQDMQTLYEEQRFLRKCNTGSERMLPEWQERVRQIAGKYVWQNADGQQHPFLSEDEVNNLTIQSGTLTAEEREIINHHIVLTIRMLENLPWPKYLQHVPEYAGGHHERMDGRGYPRGLTREQMPVQARIMGIADIFEALTAVDRPYKRGKTLTESLHILGRFKMDNHIDPDLFDVFIHEKVYLEYAKQFLDPAQIDEVDESVIPGYTP